VPVRRERAEPQNEAGNARLTPRWPQRWPRWSTPASEERLQIRVGPADKALLERAAAASHLNVSALVVQAAASRAEEVLAERSSIRLSGEAAIAFTKALEQPAQVNDRLAAAMRRERKFSWLD